MITLTPPLHLLITSMIAASPVDPASCSASDLRCTGQANLDAARRATSSPQKAKHLYRAHRAFLALADSGPEPQRVKDLCRAQQLLKQARKLPAPEVHARLVASEAETQEKFKATGIECQPHRRSKPSNPPLVAATTVPAEAPPPLLPLTPSPASNPALDTASPTTTTSIATSPPAAGHDELLPVVARPARHLDHQPRRAHTGRGLLIGGGVTLSVGLALAGAAGYMGGRLVGAWRESRDLHEAAGPLGSVDESARDAMLASDYQRLRAPTLAVALIGGSTLVVGAVLVGVGARRLARVTSRAAILPMPGGLVFRARF